MRVVAILALLVAGCVGPADTPPSGGAGEAPTAPGAFVLSSAAFEDGGAIPEEHTCDGGQASPPLAFSGAPAGTGTFALLVIDSDVPTPQTPLREVVHWLVWDVTVVAGGAEFPPDALPAGAVEGEQGWRGPCPPLGSPAHRYVFAAHAVDGVLGLAEGSSRADLERALEGRSLAEARLVGLYTRALPGS